MDEKARAALARMVAMEGPAIGEDPRRVEGLLRDMAPTCRAEISVLTACARARVPQVLGQSGGNVPLELRIGRLARELEEDAALAPAAARWGVESWAYALGLPVQAARQTSAPVAAPVDADDVWAPVKPPAAPPATSAPATPAAPPVSMYAPAYAPPLGPGTRSHEPIGPGPRAPEQPARGASEGGSQWVSVTAVPVAAPAHAAPAPVAAPPAKRSRWKRWSGGLIAAIVLIRGCASLMRMAGTDDAEPSAADSASADSTVTDTTAAVSAPTGAAPGTTTAAAPSPGAPSPGAPEPSAPLVSAPPASASYAATASAGGPREGRWLIKWAQGGVQYTGLLTMTGDDRGELRVLEGPDSTHVIGIREPVRLIRDDASGATGWVRGDSAIVVKGTPPAGFSYSPDQLRYATGSDGTVQFTQVCDASNACQPLLLSYSAGKATR